MQFRRFLSDTRTPPGNQRGAPRTRTLILLCGLLVAATILQPGTAAAGSYGIEQTLTDPTNTAYDYFGFATVMSADGNTLVVSGRLFSTGAGIVYVYERGAGGFPAMPTQTLTDPGANPGQNGFGGSVALSADGTMLLIGASGTATGGAAYLYMKVSGSFPTVPTQTFTDPAATLDDQFGKAVAVRADRHSIVIGAPGTNNRKGAIYIYVSTSALSASSRTNALPGPQAGTGAPFPAPPHAVFDPADLTGDMMGDLLSLPSNADPFVVNLTHLLVRLAGTSGHPGKTYSIVYPESGGGAPTVTDITPFSGAASPVYFQGSGLAQSTNSDTVVIGSPVSSGFKGVAFVSTLVNGSYTVTQTLTNPGMNGDQFGYAAAMSADGTMLLIGTRGTSSQPGAAYLYVKVNGSFPAMPTQTFADPTPINFDLFGSAVAMSSNGTTLIVGADGTNSGRGVVYTYRVPPVPVAQPTRHADAALASVPISPLPTPQPTTAPGTAGTVAPQPVRH